MGAVTLPLLLTFALGYLLGSIPFGLLLTRAAGLGDIRNVGSGNIGATNVLRTGNKALAAATLFLDAIKGTIAVWIAGYLGAKQFMAYAATAAAGGAAVDPASAPQIITFMVAGGLGAFIGHIYPVWLGFKGGKGVATYIGVLFGIFWPAGVAFCAIWLLVAVTTKYSSLSALIASLATPAVMWGLGARQLAILLLPLSLLLIYKHQANIQRLLKGEEPKIGAKS